MQVCFVKKMLPAAGKLKRAKGRRRQVATEEGIQTTSAVLVSSPERGESREFPFSRGGEKEGMK
jgi:hypothetical protein